MKIAVAKEIDPSEPRVAISPDTVKKFKALGVDVVIEPGAGLKSGMPDSDFTAVGATISADALKDADIVIQPQLDGMKGNDFQGRSKAILAGEQAAAAVMPELKRKLEAMRER